MDMTYLLDRSDVRDRVETLVEADDALVARSLRDALDELREHRAHDYSPADVTTIGVEHGRYGDALEEIKYDIEHALEKHVRAEKYEDSSQEDRIRDQHVLDMLQGFLDIIDDAFTGKREKEEAREAAEKEAALKALKAAHEKKVAEQLAHGSETVRFFWKGTQYAVIVGARFTSWCDKHHLTIRTIDTFTDLPDKAFACGDVSDAGKVSLSGTKALCKAVEKALART